MRTLEPWTRDICLYIFLVTIEYGLVLLTRVFNCIYSYKMPYKSCNTIHYKKSLYFLVVENHIHVTPYIIRRSTSLYFLVVEKKVHKNVKCSRFECPYCEHYSYQIGLAHFIYMQHAAGINNSGNELVRDFWAWEETSIKSSIGTVCHWSLC